MTPKQQNCGNYYLSGLSMRASMIKAGYTEQYAETHCSNFFKNRELMDYIRKRQQDEADSALADAIFIKADLKRVILDSNASVPERIEARKLLEKILERDQKIANKLNEIELKDEIKTITINIDSVKPLDSVTE